jgi:formylglycine-generating enzyme
MKALALPESPSLLAIIAFTMGLGLLAGCDRAVIPSRVVPTTQEDSSHVSIADKGLHGIPATTSRPIDKDGPSIAAFGSPGPVRSNPAAPDAKPPGPAPEGMVWIPGGTFWMGGDDPSWPDAKPVHEISVDGYWIDRTEVTNRQFAAFVKATGYITVAERKPDARDFPDAPPESLVPGSLVFTPPTGEVSLDNPLVWWRYVPGANWRHPEGPDTTIDGKDDFPVVQVCWDDAVAYTRWANKRLPTEAEWEYAARGGKERSPFVWGDEFKPGGKWQANIWQGRFPIRNTSDDGYLRTAPVATFPPNAFGLFDMAGNVWEWCSDWYRPRYEVTPTRNPQGPETSFDPQEPAVSKRVQRGGSFLCTDTYCTSYRPGARGKGSPDSAASHVGFRCVKYPAREAK